MQSGVSHIVSNADPFVDPMPESNFMLSVLFRYTEIIDAHEVKDFEYSVGHSLQFASAQLPKCQHHKRPNQLCPQCFLIPKWYIRGTCGECAKRLSMTESISRKHFVHQRWLPDPFTVNPDKYESPEPKWQQFFYKPGADAVWTMRSNEDALLVFAPLKKKIETAEIREKLYGGASSQELEHVVFNTMHSESKPEKAPKKRRSQELDQADNPEQSLPYDTLSGEPPRQRRRRKGRPSTASRTPAFDIYDENYIPDTPSKIVDPELPTSSNSSRQSNRQQESIPQQNGISNTRQASINQEHT